MSTDQEQQNPVWLTPKEAAAHLRISVRQLYRLTEQGQLPAYHLGRSRRYKRQDLDALLRPRGAE